MFNKPSVWYCKQIPKSTVLFSRNKHQSCLRRFPTDLKGWCGTQMATLDKAEALLEDLRSASWDAAVKDLEEVKAFAAKQVRYPTTLSSLYILTDLVPQYSCTHVSAACCAKGTSTSLTVCCCWAT